MKKKSFLVVISVLFSIEAQATTPPAFIPLDRTRVTKYNMPMHMAKAGTPLPVTKSLAPELNTQIKITPPEAKEASKEMNSEHAKQLLALYNNP